MISSCWLGRVIQERLLIQVQVLILTLTFHLLPYQEEAVTKEMVMALVMTVLLKPDPL